MEEEFEYDQELNKCDESMSTEGGPENLPAEEDLYSLYSLSQSAADLSRDSRPSPYGKSSELIVTNLCVCVCVYICMRARVCALM